jgi:hypothetical protein
MPMKPTLLAFERFIGNANIRETSTETNRAFIFERGLTRRWVYARLTLGIRPPKFGESDHFQLYDLDGTGC